MQLGRMAELLVPANARAIQANIAAVGPTGGGNVRLYPGDGTTPPTSSYLATVEDIFGFPRLGAAQGAANMMEFFAP